LDIPADSFTLRDSKKSNNLAGLKGSKQGQETVQLDTINIDTQTFEVL